VGITVSSRVGDSVTRNRLKRYVRDIFRHRRAALATVLDVVVIAKPGAHTLTHAQAVTELERALELAPAR
jgi:ribonuclease P protein component